MPGPQCQHLLQRCRLRQAWLAGESDPGAVSGSLPVFLLYRTAIFLSWYCSLGSWWSCVTPKLGHSYSLVRQVRIFCWHMIVGPWAHGFLEIVGKLLVWLHHTGHPVLHTWLCETLQQAVPIQSILQRFWLLYILERVYLGYMVNLRLKKNL